VLQVSQLRNSTEAVAKIHQCVSNGFMEFSNETIRILIPKRTLGSDRESNSGKKQKPVSIFAVNVQLDV